ncbi:hypothetical protein [Algihabitans albus]|uniref:hypothetical protein n=1 Tax=Algihabitans albus TaxID=2164067 RepID=UPI000E5D89FA|nr:hypothetical protein [Algihabitans albus]
MKPAGPKGEGSRGGGLSRLRLTAAGPTLVRAREKGFYPAQRRAPGEVFALREGETPAAWMEPLAPGQAAPSSASSSARSTPDPASGPPAERGNGPSTWSRPRLAAFLRERGQTAPPRAKDATLAARVAAILAVEGG